MPTDVNTSKIAAVHWLDPDGNHEILIQTRFAGETDGFTIAALYPHEARKLASDILAAVETVPGF